MSRVPDADGGGSSGKSILRNCLRSEKYNKPATTSRKMKASKPQLPGVTRSGSITGGGALNAPLGVGFGSPAASTVLSSRMPNSLITRAMTPRPDLDDGQWGQCLPPA